MQKEIKWLIDNREILKISAVERQIGCPAYTLQNMLQGKQDLPAKWEEPLITWVHKMARSLEKIRTVKKIEKS